MSEQIMTAAERAATVVAVYSGHQRYGYGELERMICAAITEGQADARRQALADAAALARERQRHYDERCPAECRCTDGAHIADAIESLAGQELEQ